jgi:hypothetical protein
VNLSPDLHRLLRLLQQRTGRGNQKGKSSNQRCQFDKDRVETYTEKTAITESTGSAKEETTIPDTLFVKKIAVTQGVVTCIEGDVRIKRQGSNTFSKLTVNSILNPGDIIQTAASSRAEIVINRESVVRLNEKTEMTLEALRDTGKEDSKTRIGFPQVRSGQR